MTELDQVGLKHGTDKASNLHGYLSVYDRAIRDAAGDPGTSTGTLLELGWWKGDSVRMWSEWLPKWKIIGLDIEEKEPIPGVTFVRGDQTDTKLAADLAQTHGPFDVIVDDASHVSPLTIASFEAYWPLLRPGGLYFVEDLQVSYHRDWKGWDPTQKLPAFSQVREGQRTRTVMEFLKGLTDAVHAGHAGMGPSNPRPTDVSHVAFWPGLCLIKKGTGQ